MAHIKKISNGQVPFIINKREKKLRSYRGIKPTRPTIKVQNWNIHWALRQFAQMNDNYLLSVPFRMIFRKTHSGIEDQMAAKYPDFMDYIQMDQEQKSNYIKMKREVYDALTELDMMNIVAAFNQHMYFKPFFVSDVYSFAWIDYKVENVDVKTWQNEPSIVLEAELMLDLGKMISTFVDKFFHYKTIRSFQMIMVQAMFSYELPLLLRRAGDNEAREIILKIVQQHVYSGKGWLSPIAQQRLKMNDAEFKKMLATSTRKGNIKLYWKGNQEIRFEISDVTATLLEKIWANKWKIAAGVGIIASGKKNR